MAAEAKTRLFRRRLRSRIIASLAAFGVGLTSLFAIATFFLRGNIENQLVDSWLANEAANFVEFKRENPSPEAQYQFSRQILIWVRSPRTIANMPYEWQKLETGVYDFSEENEGERLNYKLAVHRANDIISFLRYDYTQETLSERNLLLSLLGAILVFSVLAVLLGIWSSSRVMQPVADLVTRLKSFAGGGQPEALAPYFADDEVGQLAAAFDDYSAKLTELVKRDREFNADVSHELRTPLAVIRGATELMQAQPDLNDKSALRLARIERAVAQCSDLIDALLTLSRSERGHGAADLRKIVEQLIDTHRLALRNKPVTLQLEDGPHVVIDAPESVVSVALNNLVGNAVKYTSEGAVRVRVLRDRVEIIDNGPGIDPEDARQLFERGFRGKSSLGSKGAGIGLAIVTRLCDLYGWEVSLAPNPEGGAIATLRLLR
ncbi:sensor histidine kinase [Pseudomarimonas arenosa]|uniref:histidine kinase n=1 Tax=Pseudomarimonas arenosa TaxID=2774145 RepID=A0AAW3ZDF0_9GAMM|nr:HAMP domain-containing sensor histidine kinase [Pseudomarimonas arenosa]MBD8524221.1 HAMP domain-containing histidine kinase [Pseudomarimonas arenosa]